jgi:NTP pyrophosphatase (non-canonical NTP hydrolase)
MEAPDSPARDLDPHRVTGRDYLPAAELAAEYRARLDRDRGPLPDWYWAGKVHEEAGEAWKAWVRLAGWGRVPGSELEYAEELADVVISAYCAAARRGINLDRAVRDKHAVLMTRPLGYMSAHSG